MTSSFVQHLASYPETPTGSRALAAHLRNDHGVGGAIYRRAEDHPVHSAMHVVAHHAERGELLCTCSAFHRPHPYHGPAAAGAEPAGYGIAGDASWEHEWKCVSQHHGPEGVYRCRCGQTATGSEIGVTEQARDWFYAPAGQRQARVTTHSRLPGYHRHNSAAARALARHLRGEGFQSVDIDPADPGAAGLLAAWDAPQGQAPGPSPLPDW